MIKAENKTESETQNAMPAPMPASTTAPVLAEPGTFEAILSKLPAKDRVKAEKTMAAFELSDAPRAAMWRRLGALLMSLAGHAVKVSGPQSLQFFVADGNYRKQIFALDDKAEIGATVYCTDVLDGAIKSGLVKVASEADQTYSLGNSKDTLMIERLTGEGPEHPAFFKDMLSWNRRAIRISVPATATPLQVKTVETLCRQSVPPPKPATGPQIAAAARR
ncbi:MAG: hypothetical protein H7144_10755 [Burkholderiales bacterium]|nr:hypothetical protein [Phycisphaerae bacterium]